MIAPPNRVSGWVREFYAILLTMDWFVPLPTIRIQGQNVSMDDATINDTLSAKLAIVHIY